MSQRLLLLAFGLPGMGKTTFLHDFIVEEGAGHRFFIVDRADEWTPEAVHWRGKAPPMRVVEDGERISHSDFEEPGLYVFRGWNAWRVARLAIEVGNVVVVDDELDLSATKEGWKESPFREIVHQGRHLRNAEGEICAVHLLGACRRPQSLHPDVTAIADRVLIFRINGALTLDRLRRDAYIEDEEWDTIRTLPKYAYREWPSGEYFQLAPIGGETPKKEDEQESPSLPEAGRKAS